jgi:hypothetical protein
MSPSRVLKGGKIRNIIFLFLAIAILTSFLVLREQPPPVKTVLYKDHAISILKNNHIEALNISDWKLDKKFTSALQRRNPRFLFSDSKNLTMINKDGAYIWSDKEFGWKNMAKLPISKKEDILDIFLCGQRIFIVCPTKIRDLSENRDYNLPEMRGLIKVKRLRLQAVYVGKGKVWLGTGYGEWGGHLLILDVITGKWRQFYNPLLYVNSIAEDKDETIWVAWAMSHFIAYTSLMPIGKAYKESAYFKDHYLQVIAYNKYDDTLCGLDENHLIRFKDGKLEQVYDLDNMRYLRDEYAVGVIPYIDDLLIVGKDIFLIPHKKDGLFLYERGHLRKLEESKSTAYWFTARYEELKEEYDNLKFRIKLQINWLYWKYFNNN